MAVHQKGDLQFSPNTVRRGDQDRFLITLQVEGNTSCKTPDLSQYLRTKG